MDILNNNKLRLDNDVSDITTSMNPDLDSGIYLTAVKL